MPSIKVRGLPPPQDHEHTGVGDGGALGTGVVDTAQLADEAVDNAKVAAAADIVKSKLAALEIVDADVAAGAAISKDKLAALARAGLYHGDEIEVSVTGTTEEQVKDLAIIIDPTNALDLKTLKIVARLKSSDGVAQTSLAIYHGGGGVADLTLTSTSAAYEEVSGTIDVSGWGTGRHTIEIKLVSDNVAETAFNELLEIYFVM